uniref:Uncharacterized protein n=1 Tax=Anopheles arabiensis TaxID=7173 RepID=A0A182IFX8_ANOAR
MATRRPKQPFSTGCEPFVVRCAATLKRKTRRAEAV